MAQNAPAQNPECETPKRTNEIKLDQLNSTQLGQNKTKQNRNVVYNLSLASLREQRVSWPPPLHFRWLASVSQN